MFISNIHRFSEQLNIDFVFQNGTITINENEIKNVQPVDFYNFHVRIPMCEVNFYDRY